MTRVCVHRFIKRMCKALGLLQDIPDTDVDDEAEGSGSFRGRRPSRMGRAMLSPTIAESLTSKTPTARHRHRMVGGMDVIQHSNPFLADVLQVWTSQVQVDMLA